MKKKLLHMILAISLGSSFYAHAYRRSCGPIDPTPTSPGSYSTADDSSSHYLELMIDIILPYLGMQERMRLTGWDVAFWGIGYTGYVCLMAVLLIKQRYRVFPWFTILLAGEMVQTIILVLVRAYSHWHYFHTYWAFEILDSLLRIAVLVELTRIVLRQLNRKQFVSESLIPCGGLVLLAGLAAWKLTPNLNLPLTNAAFKITVFAGLLLLGLTAMILLTVFFYGMRFRVHSTAITYGLGVYSAGKFMVFAAVFGITSTYWWGLFEKTLKPLYIVCLATWCFFLWFEEPTRKLTLEMQAILMGTGVERASRSRQKA